jgi:hypothetical protein
MCLSSVLFAVSAYAQFHLPHLGSSSTTTAPNEDAMLQSFIQSQGQILAAQVLLAKAYGLKDQAAACEAQETALQSSGVDTDTLKKTVDVSNSANAAIAEQQDKQAALTAQEKTYYAQSLPHFAEGVLGTRKVVQEAEQFAGAAHGSMGLSTLSGGITKLRSATFIARAMPSYSKSVYSVFRKTVEIGRNNGVQVPSNATAALGSLN